MLDLTSALRLTDATTIAFFNSMQYEKKRLISIGFKKHIAAIEKCGIKFDPNFLIELVREISLDRK